MKCGERGRVYAAMNERETGGSGTRPYDRKRIVSNAAERQRAGERRRIRERSRNLPVV